VCLTGSPTVTNRETPDLTIRRDSDIMKAESFGLFLSALGGLTVRASAQEREPRTWGFVPGLLKPWVDSRRLQADIKTEK
jgi:hypothetical protein